MAVQLTNEMIQAAQLNQEKYGVPASITLGQIILESSGSYSGGVSKLAYAAKNLFGMKGAGPAGTYLINTVEESPTGKQYVTTAGFRKYNSYAESIADHGKLLTTDRYTAKTQNATTVQEYAQAIQAAGYATDSKYSEKLMSVIKSNNLTQYDTGTIGGVSPGPGVEEPEQDTNKLDLIGQVLRFILIIGLLILAVVFLLKGLGVDLGGII